MFDIGWSELVIIAVVALIAIGPKELPGVLRALGHWMGKVRRMASDFQDQFKEAMREAEVDDLKKQVDELNTAASDITSYNPIDDLSNDFETALDEKPAEEKPAETAAEDKPAEAAAVAAAEPAEETLATPAPKDAPKDAPEDAPTELAADAPATADEPRKASGGRPA
jgi:sec-independent protein translocase protein TatB